MLQERSLILQRLLFGFDVVLIGVAWVLAWVLRFEVLTPPAWAPLTLYLGFLPAVLVLWSAAFLLSGLYQTRRAQRLPLVIFSVARAVFLGLLISVAATFFYRAFSFSRLHMLFFGLISSVLLVGLRVGIYVGLRRLRQQGRNVRRVLIVGAGKAGQRLARAFRQYPWMGFDVVGFLDDRGEEVKAEPLDNLYPTASPVPPQVLGTVDEIGAVMDGLSAMGRSVHLVYAALPLAAADKIEAIAEACSLRTAHMCLVPDLFHLDLLLNSRVSHVDGLPVIHLLDEAPFDFRHVVKRTVDIAFSAFSRRCCCSSPWP